MRMASIVSGSPTLAGRGGNFAIGQSHRLARIGAIVLDPATSIGAPSSQLSGSGSDTVPAASRARHPVGHGRDTQMSIRTTVTGSDPGTAKLADYVVSASLQEMALGARGNR